MEIVSVPVIVVVVCVIMELLKGILGNKEKFMRLIPVFSAITGALIGMIIFFAAPSIIPADNLFMALLIGAASGLASTGAHQVLKQLKSSQESVSSGENTENKD